MLLFNTVIAQFQAALFSALAALAAPEGQVAEPDEIVAPEAEEVDGEADSERRTRLCSASSDFSPTGRQLARVWNSPRDPDYCLREKLGEPVDPDDYPDCWTVGRTIGCKTIVDV